MGNTVIKDSVTISIPGFIFIIPLFASFRVTPFKRNGDGLNGNLQAVHPSTVTKTTSSRFS
jgi:hypothetical protein